MRYAISASLLGAVSLLLASMWACEKDPEVAGACVDFCNELVDAMDESDTYSIDSVSKTKDACKAECTDTLSELSGGDRSDAEDCIECLAENIDGDDDWNEAELGNEAFEECEGDCFDNNDDYDDDPFVVFSEDFWEDFSEHFSYSYGGSDSDVDGDVDGDADGDADIDCDTVALQDCADDYTTCVTDCGGDTTCNDACMSDYCDCADAAGCAEYLADYC
jgi:hypothetical protein